MSFFSGDDLGEYRFNGMFSGNAFADFLLGYPNRTRVANTGPDVRPYTQHQGYFAQDDFKVTSKLTINYGVRYEYHPPFVDPTLQIANFDRNFTGGRVIVPNAESAALTAPGFKASIGSTPIVTAAEAGLPESLRFSDKNNFMPRIGFAYRPFGNRTVIRGGYGIFTVTVLGNVSYSLVGIHTSDTRTFNNALVNGVPQLSFPQPFDQGLGALTAVGNADFRRANEFHVREPYAQQWNFTVERDLGWNTGLRVTYTGSHTIGLYDSPDLNQVRANTVGYSVAKLSRPFPNWAIVYSRDTGTSAKYNSLQTEVQKRFSNSLAFQTSWVWAKNLSNSTGSDGTGFAADNGSVPTDRVQPGSRLRQRLHYPPPPLADHVHLQPSGRALETAVPRREGRQTGSCRLAVFRNRRHADRTVPDADHGRHHRPQRHQRGRSRQRPAGLCWKKLWQSTRWRAHHQQLV